MDPPTMDPPTINSLPSELLSHIATYLTGPRSTLPSLAATSRSLRLAAEDQTFRRVRIRLSGGFAMFARAFRKEVWWRRAVVREVCLEVEVSSGDEETEHESGRFTQDIGGLLSMLSEWERDESGTGWSGASGAGGIKLTIKVIRTWHKAVSGTMSYSPKTLRLLHNENEVEKILPKVRRIVGLDIIGSTYYNFTIEGASVVKLAARMPELRELNIAIATHLFKNITWMDCGSDEELRMRLDFSRTLLQALCSPDRNATTASFNSLTSFTLSYLIKSVLRRYKNYHPHGSPRREEESGQEEGGKDLFSQALHALSRLPNLKKICLLVPLGLSSEVFWPKSSAEGLAGGGEKEHQELEPFWPKLQVLKVMFAEGRPGGGWYTASPQKLPSPGYQLTSPGFSRGSFLYDSHGQENAIYDSSTEQTFYPLMEPFYPRSTSSIHILLDPTTSNPVLIAPPTLSDSRQPHKSLQTTTNPDIFNPVLTSLGKAVSRMPKLETAEVGVDMGEGIGNEIIFKFLGAGVEEEGSGSIEYTGVEGGRGKRSRWLMRVESPPATVGWKYQQCLTIWGCN